MREEIANDLSEESSETLSLSELDQLNRQVRDLERKM